jgi:hypothetical protein
MFARGMHIARCDKASCIHEDGKSHQIFCAWRVVYKKFSATMTMYLYGFCETESFTEGQAHFQQDLISA